MRFCFVSTSRGSRFMTELLRSLVSAVQEAGYDAELVLDEFPAPSSDLACVVVPHEFDAWGSPAGAPDAAQRARTIALCTENPGTLWFEETYRLVAEFGVAVSINRSSAAELCRRGIRCEHVQLGYFAGWDRWHRDEAVARPIDVLYLGAADERRDPLLAGIGARLWARECQFLVPPLEPRTVPRSDFLVDADKYERLADAKVLLNLHRTTSAAFEWMRFLEAICNGCVVVSEPSLDAAPLLAGEHFVEASAEEIAGAIDALLDDPARLREMRIASYDFVREQLPMAAAGERLVELARELPRQPPASRALSPEGASPPATPGADPLAEASEVRAAALATRPARRLPSWRSLATRLARRRSRDRSAGVLAETPPYASARPRVSVLCVMSGEPESAALLESVAGSAYGELELLIAAGPSASGGERTVRRLLERHPELATRVLGCETEGLAEARNLLAAGARGEYLLVLPAAGGVFPATIQRLARALDEDSDALFSYSMVAVFEGSHPVELRGSLPWEPERLRRENWIDAPALIAREPLLALGGWASDPALRGLEDFELWCRCAEHERSAAHVAQVLAWHPRAQDTAPRDVASLPAEAAALLRERCPRLFGSTPES
jgi:hypothetical protein